MVNYTVDECLVQESVWYEKFRYEAAERQMFEQMAKQQGSPGAVSGFVIAEKAKTRDHIMHSPGRPISAADSNGWKSRLLA